MTDDQTPDPRHPAPPPPGRVAIPRQPDASNPREIPPTGPARLSEMPPPPAVAPKAAEVPDRSPGFGGWIAPGRAEMIAAEWSAVQAGFVDDPVGAVERADELVARTAAIVAEAVGQRRRSLRVSDRAATEGGAMATEDLRLALRDYRALLDRLLAS